MDLFSGRLYWPLPSSLLLLPALLKGNAHVVWAREPLEGWGQLQWPLGAAEEHLCFQWSWHTILPAPRTLFCPSRPLSGGLSHCGNPALGHPSLDLM